MRSRVLSGAVAALVVVGLSACSSFKSDTADRVDQALKQANVKNVDVDWDKEANVVHLEGTVDTPDQRSKAEQVATDVVGTSGKVINELTVEGMDDTTADNADGLIKSRIEDAVRADPQLTNRTIDVNVTDASGDAHRRSQHGRREGEGRPDREGDRGRQGRGQRDPGREAGEEQRKGPEPPVGPCAAGGLVAGCVFGGPRKPALRGRSAAPACEDFERNGGDRPSACRSDPLDERPPETAILSRPQAVGLSASESPSQAGKPPRGASVSGLVERAGAIGACSTATRCARETDARACRFPALGTRPAPKRLVRQQAHASRTIPNRGRLSMVACVAGRGPGWKTPNACWRRECGR